MDTRFMIKAILRKAYQTWGGSRPQTTGHNFAPKLDPSMFQQTKPEVVYLSNCESPNGQSSEMNYYRHTESSQHGEYPEATAFLEHQSWEGHSITGVFPDGNKFTPRIHDHDGPYYQVKGDGFNDYHKFACHKDTFRELYRDRNKTCYSVYYCQP